ncbi:metal-sensing transcriptional repressor [Paenibacillus validus]|uniref:Metal-sensing transcriptional repressor n=1 Tax=Paenibacillus validus TaxID=44253 RepID=A0A7X2ZFQ5_9BACL|nr:metal-sensing transcriptional repressor [Paenibacillus validus]MUG73321.1 metal-sensing transcriptional repressor [Paenibacillus validus]
MTAKESKASPQTESYLNPKEKLAIALRLNRIEGQVRGVQRQVERNENCDQVFHQIAAVRNALHGVGKLVLLHQLKSCLKRNPQLNEEVIVDGMLETMNKLIR